MSNEINKAKAKIAKIEALIEEINKQLGAPGLGSFQSVILDTADSLDERLKNAKAELQIAKEVA